MAKTPRNNVALPIELPAALQEAASTPPPATYEAPIPSDVDELIEVQVPLGPVPLREFQIHIDTTLLGPHATTLRRIAAALDRKGCRLRSGTRVINANQALRYLLEQIAK